MLYIEDSDGSVWLEIAELLGERTDHDMSLCLHPGSPAAAMPRLFVVSAPAQYLELPVDYSDGEEPVCSGRVAVTAKLLRDLEAHLGDFEDWGDSLTMYPVREAAWVAAYVPHDRAIMVRDVNLHGFLDAAGIVVTHEAPEEW